MSLITPGFDESHYEYIDDPTLIKVKLDAAPGGHTGDHVAVGDTYDSATGELARVLDEESTNCILISF